MIFDKLLWGFVFDVEKYFARQLKISKRFLSTIVTKLLKNHGNKLGEVLLRRIDVNNTTDVMDYSWLTMKKSFVFQFLHDIKFFIRLLSCPRLLCCITPILRMSHSDIRSSTYFHVLPISVLVHPTLFHLFQRVTFCVVSLSYDLRSFFWSHDLCVDSDHVTIILIDRVIVIDVVIEIQIAYEFFPNGKYDVIDNCKGKLLNASVISSRIQKELNKKDKHC